MDRCSDQMTGGGDATTRSHDEEMTDTTGLVREYLYSQDGASESTYHHYDTTMKTEVQDGTPDMQSSCAAVQATQLPLTPQGSEVATSSIIQKYTTPSPNQFTPAVERVREDQLARDTVSYDVPYRPQASSFHIDASPRYMVGYQPMSVQGRPSGISYQAGQFGYGGQQQFWPSVPVSQTGYDALAGLPLHPSVMPTDIYGKLVRNMTAGSGVVSPQPQSSVNIVARSPPQAAVTGQSDLHQEPVQAGQKRSLPDDDPEFSKAKKARDKSITKSEQEYDDNKTAIEHWWRSKQGSPRAPLFEKLMSWKTYRNRFARLEPREGLPSSTPATPVETAAMESPAEIIQIRQQWKDKKPNVCRHPKDKVDVAKANWPAEDTIANSSKRSDGMYSCLHANGNFECCRVGLTEKKKKTSIDKQIRNFKAKVEKMIVNKDLHVAHKTWTNWLSDKKFKELHAGEMDRIDALLALVNGQIQSTRAPAVPQTMSQQHMSPPVASVVPSAARNQKMGLTQRSHHAQLVQTSPSATLQATTEQYIPPPASTLIPPTPQIQKPHPVQQAGHITPTSQQLHDTTQQWPQTQQSGVSTTPQSQPSLQEQHKTSPLPAPSPTQPHTLISSNQAPPVPVTHHLPNPPPAPTRKPLTEAQLLLKAAGAIYSQNERSSRQRPVIIVGIDLSKENCRDQYDHVLRKIVEALKKREEQRCAVTLSSSATSILPLDDSQIQGAQRRQTPPSPPPPILPQILNPLLPPPADPHTVPEPPPHPTTVPPSSPRITPTTLSLSPNTPLSTPEPHFPTTPLNPPVNYRQEAMKLFQQLVRDNVTIVPCGAEITRQEFTSDMNGWIGRLAVVLKREAEVEKDAEVKQAAQHTASQSPPTPSGHATHLKDPDENLTTPAIPTTTYPIWNHTSNTNTSTTIAPNANNELLPRPSTTTSPSPSPSPPPPPATWSSYIPPPSYTMNPQFICPDAPSPLAPEDVIQHPQQYQYPQQTDLEYLDAPANWYVSDPFGVIVRGGVQGWVVPGGFLMEEEGEGVKLGGIDGGGGGEGEG